MNSNRSILMIAGLALGLCGPLRAQQQAGSGGSTPAPVQAQPRNDVQLRKEIFEKRRSSVSRQRLQEQRKLLQLAQNVRTDRNRPPNRRRLPNFVTAQETPPGEAPPGETPPGDTEPDDTPADGPADPAPGEGADPAAGEGAHPAAGEGADPAAGQAADGEQVAIEAEPGKQGQIVSIGDGDIPMRDFLKFLADFTGLTVIVDSANPTFLQQQITIVAAIDRANEDIIRAILQANQVRLFRKKLDGGTEIIMIQPMAPTGAQNKDPEERIIVYQDDLDRARTEKLIKPDQFATMVFTLQHISPADAIEALRSLVGGVGAAAARGAAARSSGGASFSMVEIKNSQKLIITAKFGLLDYLRKLLDLIDVPFPEPERIIDIRQIEFADAGEIEQMLTQFLQGGRGSSFSRFTQRSVTQPRTGGASTAGRSSSSLGGQRTDFNTKLISDLRTNQLIIETYSEQDLQDIDMLIGYLDVRFTLRRVKTHIYQVRYLKAVEVAQDLQTLLQGQSSSSLGGLSRSRTRSTTSTRSSLPRVGGGASRQAPGQTGTAANQEIASLIVPHEPTNSLLIQAEREDYDQILNILSRIDTKRRQVFLEAALVQVKSNSNLTFAIDVLAGEPDDFATRGLFATQFTNPPLTSIDPITFDRSFIPGSGLPIGGLFALMHRGDFPLLVQFFKEHNDSQILATPFILADDNEPNSIEILETRFVTNTAQQSNQTTLSTQQGEPAGITLSIEPTISGSQKAVFLVMDLSVSEFDDSAGAIAGGLPPKNENTMSSSVTIPDGKIFVIGGLTRENNSKSVQKIPILGDIPLLGKLFRKEVTSRSQNNLYVFLQAHILTDEEFDDGRDLTEQASRQIEGVTDEKVDPIKFSRPDIPRRAVIDPNDEWNDRVFDLNDPSADYRRRYDDYRSSVDGNGNQRDRSGQPPYNASSGAGAVRVPEAVVPGSRRTQLPPETPQPAPVNGGQKKKSSGWFD